MGTATSARRRIARGVSIATLTAVALGGALATPASAARSPRYDTMAECRDAQRAYGSTSFVRITKSCYGIVPQIAPGVWDPNYVVYQFNYKSRY
ncbi:hypothetical protein [Thalassiella azotivora]